jgi:hypothetical protein
MVGSNSKLPAQVYTAPLIPLFKKQFTYFLQVLSETSLYFPTPLVAQKVLALKGGAGVVVVVAENMKSRSCRLVISNSI